LVDLSHLEPLEVTFHSQKLGRNLTFRVRFANHVFTDHFKDGIHDPARLIMDGKERRVYCQTRYDLSKRLPDMMRDLPNQAVARSRHGRNFVYATTLNDGQGGHYPCFFKLEKERATRHQIAIFVESAYGVTAEEMANKLLGSRSMSFALLCADTFHVAPIRKSKARR